MWYSRSVVSDSVTPWTAVCQAPLSMGFSRQEHWSGLSVPSPGDLPDLEIEPCLLRLPHWQADSLPLNHQIIYKMINIINTALRYLCKFLRA